MLLDGTLVEVGHVWPCGAIHQLAVAWDGHQVEHSIVLYVASHHWDYKEDKKICHLKRVYNGEIFSPVVALRDWFQWRYWPTRGGSAVGDPWF